ncbi:MAG: Lrp/AsnC family transcriptional regulator [Nanoarchaeota archaeon]|nr:Lrp/AsnC family transcriptional regulator [Nanoarchaeota archaeon]MBU1103790.1 Lrp/AsnC family transcriptional regulator [Nanoarchaeota archaeon]
MKLDAIDKKLIKYLYHSYRKPITQIAKACRISRDQAEYRLKKFESQGFIKKYVTIFNYALLGYNEFIIVWLKVSSKKQQIKSSLEKSPNVVSVGETLSKYDLFVDFVFKDKDEFEEKFSNLLKENKEITHYEVFTTTSSSLYPLKTFGEQKEAETYTFMQPVAKVTLQQKDIALMKALETNGRAKITDLSKKINLSGELIAYKLKQLYKKKIILGNRIQFDMEKLGFNFAALKLKLNPLEKNKIKSFCQQHKNINALVFGISKYNCIIQFFYQEEKELRDAIKDINSTFQQDIQDSELLLMENEGNVKTLPF